jgi:hypothetical protein
VYLRLAEESGYACNVLVTHIASRREEFIPHRPRLVPGEDFTPDDVALVERIRPRLPAALRAMTTEDLLVTGIFLCARKPAG